MATPRWRYATALLFVVLAVTAAHELLTDTLDRRGPGIAIPAALVIGGMFLWVALSQVREPTFQRHPLDWRGMRRDLRELRGTRPSARERHGIRDALVPAVLLGVWAFAWAAYETEWENRTVLFAGVAVATLMMILSVVVSAARQRRRPGRERPTARR